MIILCVLLGLSACTAIFGLTALLSPMDTDLWPPDGIGD